MYVCICINNLVLSNNRYAISKYSTTNMFILFSVNI